MSQDAKDPKDPKEPEEPASDTEKLRTAALLAVGAAAAVFTALGIEGETLRRAIRNDPYGTAWPIVFVIVGLTVPLLYLTFKRAWPSPDKAAEATETPPNYSKAHVLGRRLLTVAPSLLVLGGLVWLVFAGAKSLNEREMPTISAAASKVSDTTVNVKFKAVAPSLRSDEKILLKVLALNSAAVEKEVSDFCLDPEVILPNSDGGNPKDEKIRVLFWGESGPSRAGEGTVTADVSASSAEFRYVCVLAQLHNTDKEYNPGSVCPRFLWWEFEWWAAGCKTRDYYFAWSVTDLINPLDQIATTPAPTPPGPTKPPSSGDTPATTGPLGATSAR